VRLYKSFLFFFVYFKGDMKMFKIAISIIIIALFLSGCGVRFASAPVNADLPRAFTSRALYPAGVAGYEFQDLVGNIGP